MNLAVLFESLAYKKLTSVDLPGRTSHQHEVNGVAALRRLFGTATMTRGSIIWYFFADDHPTRSETSTFTFYDARAKSARITGRSEWRMYYDGGFLSHAHPGDWLIIIRSQTGDFHALVLEAGSSWLRAARSLFRLTDAESAFVVIEKRVLASSHLALLERRILAELDLSIDLPADPADEELVSRRFGRNFPTTREMSEFARSLVDVGGSDCDGYLTGWLEKEEELFRALENTIILDRIKRGFEAVDEFVEYSLSVQNRRKSRMGHALQNHLEELFIRNHLRFTPQARTEGHNRPDFVFPGESEYHKRSFDSSRLLMLAAKSTCKDRWRQVIPEADRISTKHLCTLEPGISLTQTEEMVRQGVRLVVPEILQETYTRAQRRSIMTVQGFVDLVRHKQS